MAKLLEATIKMTKYFEKSYKHSKPHPKDNSNNHTSANHYSNSHSDRHKNKPCNNSGKLNEITDSTYAFNNTPSEPEINKEHCDSDSSDSILNSSLDLEWLSRENKSIEV